MATIKYKDENGQWQEIVVGGGSGTGGGSVYNVYAYETLTEEQKAANKAAYNAFAKSKDVICYVNVMEDGQSVSVLIDSFVYVPDNLVFLQGTNVQVGDNDIYYYNIDVYVFPDGNAQVAYSSSATTPTTSKVEEMIAIAGGGGLELRELKMSGSADDNAYNLETLELMRENKVLPAMNAGDGTLVPLTYGGNGQFILQVVQMGIEMQMSVTMAGDGSITMSQDVLAPYVLLTSSRVLEWLTKNKMLAQMGSFEPAFAYYQAQFCLIDYYKATTGDNTKAVVQFNYGSQRFERVYNATTGEEISTTEIPLGGGTAAEGTKLYPIYVPYFLETESLTTEQQQANADAVAAATNGDKIILELLLPDGLKAIAHSYSVMDGALILDLARSGILNQSDYQAYVDMVILFTDGSVAYDSHDVFTLASKEYVDKAVANSGGGGGLEYLEFDDPTTADEVMSIISTIQQRYDTTGKMPVAWINGNGGHSLILQIIYQSERDGVLVTRLMDSEVMYFVTSGALLVVPSSLVMRLDASASDNNKMVAALLQLVSFTQWQMFNIPIYLEIDGVMYEAVGKSKESNGTVYGSFVVGNTLKIYKLTHSENGVFVPLLKSEIPLGGGTAAEGAKLYPIYSPKLMGADSITEEQKAVNKAAFEAAARGEQMWCYAAIDDGANKLNALLFNGNAEMLIVTFNVPMVHQDITEQLTNVIITPDGSILHEAQYEVTSPSIERVEEMIAASIGDINTILDNINGEEV